MCQEMFYAYKFKKMVYMHSHLFYKKSSGYPFSAHFKVLQTNKQKKDKCHFNLYDYHMNHYCRDHQRVAWPTK